MIKFRSPGEVEEKTKAPRRSSQEGRRKNKRAHMVEEKKMFQER